MIYVQKGSTRKREVRDDADKKENERSVRVQAQQLRENPLE